MRRSKVWAFRLATLGLALLICEGLLRAMSAVSPQARFYLSPPWAREVTLPDPELGHRMTSLYPGNDTWGFRNPRVPAHTDVLAIGDSMTYGFGAPADQCWPRQLEHLTGTMVYAMASGGYSPVEYGVLFQRGLALTPKTVIITLYTGNDISGAYSSVHTAGRGQQFDLHDPAIERELADAAARAPFADAYARLADAPDARRSGGGIRRWVSEHSAIYALARGLWAAISDQRGISMGEEADEHSFEESARQPGRYVYNSDRRFRTVFLDAGAYMMGMDLEDPRIREGLRITQAVLTSAEQQSRARGIRLIVAIIPTKETVYAPLMVDEPNVPAAYFRLVRKEQGVIDALATFVAREQVDLVDTTPALRSAFTRGLRPFPASDNTHPNANGYGAIATAVADAIGHGRSTSAVTSPP